MTAMPRAAWTKLVRRLGWDDNPLRPRSDLMGRWLLPAVIIIFVAMCPVVATVTGMRVRADNAAVVHAQRDWRPVTAVLLRAAPGSAQSDHGTNTWLTWTPARWRVAGQSRVGDVPAVAGSRAGSRQTVWLNRAGQVQVPPLTARQVGNRVRADTAMALAALAFVLAGLWLLARRALNRRRLRDWEMEWLTVGPLWTHHG
jgi:hypothetical protein